MGGVRARIRGRLGSGTAISIEPHAASAVVYLIGPDGGGARCPAGRRAGRPLVAAVARGAMLGAFLHAAVRRSGGLREARLGVASVSPFGSIVLRAGPGIFREYKRGAGTISPCLRDDAGS